MTQAISIYANTGKEMADSLSGINKTAGEIQKIFQNMNSTLTDFTNFSKNVQDVTKGLNEMSRAGFTFQQSMADLSAKTGLTGRNLKELENSAREVGRSSGIGAVQAAETFKTLTSQVNLSKVGLEGLKTLQKETVTLAQATGTDMTTAASALSGTINQFELQAGEANRVVNLLAAGARYGTANVPELAQSFKVVGTAAHAAGMTVEETAAAIEVLGKNNLKGAEAGDDLLAILTQMQAVPGIDIGKTGLSDALESLQPKLKDANFLTETFGAGNEATARYLIEQADALHYMTGILTVSNVATEQAEIRTGTFEGRLQKIRAKCDDLKITFGNTFGEVTLFANHLNEIVTPISQLIPLFQMIGKSIIALVKDFAPLIDRLTKFGSKAGSLFKGGSKSGALVKSSTKELIGWTPTFSASTKKSGSFASKSMSKRGGSMFSSLFSSAQKSAAFPKEASQGVSTWVSSLSTANAKTGSFANQSAGTFTKLKNAISVTSKSAGKGLIGMLSSFASAASACFGLFKTVAVSVCRTIGFAVMSIPIIGWIAAIIAAITALFVYLYQTNAGFRGFIDGLGNAIKEFFGGIWGYISECAEGMIGLLKGIFNPANWFSDDYKFSDHFDKLINADKKFSSKIINGFKEGQDKSLQESAAKEGATDDEEQLSIAEAGGGNTINEGIGSIGGGGGENKIRNINTQIGSLIERFEIHTNNIGNDIGNVRNMVAEALVSAVNDLNTVGA